MTLAQTNLNPKDGFRQVISVDINNSQLSIVLDGNTSNYLATDWITTAPAANFIGVITQFDGNGDVLKREKVLVDSRSVSTLTINASGRGFDDSTAQTFTAADGTINFDILVDETTISRIQANQDGHETRIASNETHAADTANPHATDIENLGGGTLAELNSAISDATLDDSGDSRAPSGTAGGDLNGTYPNPSVDDGADATAIHDNVASEISAITEKVTPVNADLVIIEDSADSNNKKRVQVGNLPGGGGGDPFDDADWNDDAATTTWASSSTFTVTDNATNQDIFTVGRPLRYQLGGSGGFINHGIVTGYATGTVTIKGVSLGTIQTVEMEYRRLSAVVTIKGLIGGLQATGDDQFPGLRHDSQDIEIVAVYAEIETATSGGADVSLAVGNNAAGTDILSATIDMTTAATVVNSGVTITQTNQTLTAGNRLFINIDSIGTTDPGGGLTLRIIGVLS